jgi:hypothetical protein
MTTAHVHRRLHAVTAPDDAASPIYRRERLLFSCALTAAQCDARRHAPDDTESAAERAHRLRHAPANELRYLGRIVYGRDLVTSTGPATECAFEPNDITTPSFPVRLQLPHALRDAEAYAAAEPDDDA